MKLMKPTVETDGGPWAIHDMPCAIYQDKPAVLDLNTGMFHPSWRAQEDGWMLVKVPRWARWIVRLISSR